MLNYLDITGRNEEDAIAAALAQLKLDRDDVSVEVLERAKSGFLGIGSSPAKVRVTYEVPDEAPAAAPTPTAAADSAEEKPVQAPQTSAPAPVEAKAEIKAEETPETPETAPEAPSAGQEDEKAARITAFLTGLLEHMQVQAVPVVEQGEEGTYRVNLEGENLGPIIGRRGETLDAIQQLTSYSVNRGAAKRVRIQVDAEHYRAKREETLIRLANRVADKVVKYRRNVTLEPMNAYERHVIHTALQDYPGVTTYSTGTEPNRRTVVAYEK